MEGGAKDDARDEYEIVELREAQGRGELTIKAGVKRFALRMLTFYVFFSDPDRVQKCESTCRTMVGPRLSVRVSKALTFCKPLSSIPNRART